ncbi:hypothetical protein [Rufibacter tibetensis]|uniref:Uncharacterized protein n=1 Tax=Rufibacter tibetensis TaxID=512763 RepID=A0A0P0CUH8_9BACT|nr:hypothetical protein [Rufibacter tibetensis]ALI98943.1 hypothetical protein DC20_08080 [Rufibacter tibetensis]
MRRNFYALSSLTTNFLALSFTLLVLTSFGPKYTPITVKKGDKIEYQVVSKKVDKKVIDMFTYMNESGTAVSGFRCTPASLNKSFVAKADNQKIALVISLHHLSKEVISARILVNGEVVQEASTGEGVVQLDLEVAPTNN